MLLWLLYIEERAKTASRYEMWQSVVEVQRCCRAQNEMNAITIKDVYNKLFESCRVKDWERSGRLEGGQQQFENVNIVQALFDEATKNQQDKEQDKVDIAGMRR